MPKVTKVAIDTRDLKKGKTGTYTYLKSLCEVFSEQNGAVQYFFIQYRLPVYHGNSKLGKITEHILFTLWKQFLLPTYCIIYKIDILFCSDYFLPLIPMHAKKVVVFHDTFFYEEPQHYNFWWLKTFHWIAEKGAKKASHIIVPTHYVRERLLSFLPVNKEKISVVFEGPKEIIQTNELNKGILQREQVVYNQWKSEIETFLDGSKYLLHVGTLDFRKNLETLVAALEILLLEFEKKSDTQPIKLIIVGDSPKYFSSNGKAALIQLIQNKKLDKYILLTGRVIESQLAYLYQHAFVYVFPSLNEGFGLPLVEAMQYNIPIAAANNSALPEVGGDAAIYFDPMNVNDMAYKIKTLIQDESLREKLKKAAIKRITLFNWRDAGEHLKKIFLQLNQNID